MENPLSFALIGAAVTALSTSVGALPALVTHRISERAQDSLIGFVLMMFLDVALSK